MNLRDGVQPLSRRLLYLMGLNLSIGLLVALLLWSLQTSLYQPRLSSRISASLIDSTVYGLCFGLTMPYLGERLALLRTPWNWAAIIASLLLMAPASSLVVELSLLGLGLLKVENFWPEVFYKSLGVFFIALIVGVGIYTYEKFRGHIQATNLQLRTQELEKERALKLATEARLASLESKLHPHFLFNTLNSISALIAEDPALADQMVQRLAALLRNSLDACEQSRVPLSAEIAFVSDYLEIERARFRERLSYSIEVEAGLESWTVPPLTLQPVVENSVKYAVAPRPAGGQIKLKARRQADGLLIEVWDDGPGFTTEMITRGHSLDNLQARLTALLGPSAKLRVNPNDGGTSVTLYLPHDDSHDLK